MANEQEETGDFLLKNFLPVENVNNQVEGAASLESTHSSESGASSLLTQIEAISLSNVIEIPASTRNQTKSAADAKDGEGGDPSSSLEFHHITSSTNTTTKTTTTLVNYGMESGVEEDIQKETNSAATTPTAHDGKKSISASFERDEEMEEQCGGGDQDDDLDQSYEDDTLSSEAVVDDIELILMPETVQDFPSADLSPQLVRVTELKRPLLDYDTDVFDDDDERRSDQESDFQKFGTDDENSEISGSVSSRSKLRRRVLLASSSLGGGDDDGKEGLSSGRRDYMGQSDQQKSGRKVSCGAQTEITALETTSSSNPFELKQRRPVGKSSTKSSGLGLGPTGKRRLNWKSELTLLPSKTKIRTSGFSGYEPMNYQDQYSPRVAKFTSQDTLSSSSQFLKPSTLYRTRNLSRNLNQSSDSTLALTAAGLPSTSESARNRDRMSSSTSSNFKESYSSYHISSSISRRQQQPPPLTSGHSVSFRSSLPDISSSQSGHKGPRQSFKSMKQNKFSGGCRKKSSSDDETSSLIDESERCLRSSIDLLLTDDLPSPGADFTTRSTGFGGRSRASFGYYSSGRSHSQPILMDDGDCGDLRDVTMGSPFLPRKLSDMRCSRIAKVILPSGQVAVVSVKEMDEMRDTLTVHTDTGCVLSLPFRKVVFAWKITR